MKRNTLLTLLITIAVILASVTSFPIQALTNDAVSEEDITYVSIQIAKPFVGLRPSNGKAFMKNLTYHYEWEIDAYSTEWFKEDGTVLSNDEIFEKDKTYKVQMKFHPAEGCYFRKDTVVDLKTDPYQQLEMTIKDSELTVTTEFKSSYNPNVTLFVEKSWENNKALVPFVKVQLYLDGEPSNQWIELSDQNGWKAEFVNIPKQNPYTGEDYQYFIEEDGTKQCNVYPRLINCVEYNQELYQVFTRVQREGPLRMKYTITNTKLLANFIIKSKWFNSEQHPGPSLATDVNPHPALEIVKGGKPTGEFIPLEEKRSNNLMQFEGTKDNVAMGITKINRGNYVEWVPDLSVKEQGESNGLIVHKGKLYAVIYKISYEPSGGGGFSFNNHFSTRGFARENSTFDLLHNRNLESKNLNIYVEIIHREINAMQIFAEVKWLDENGNVMNSNENVFQSAIQLLKNGADTKNYVIGDTSSTQATQFRGNLIMGGFPIIENGKQNVYSVKEKSIDNKSVENDGLIILDKTINNQGVENKMQKAFAVTYEQKVEITGSVLTPKLVFLITNRLMKTNIETQIQIEDHLATKNKALEIRPGLYAITDNVIITNLNQGKYTLVGVLMDISNVQAPKQVVQSLPVTIDANQAVINVVNTLKNVKLEEGKKYVMYEYLLPGTFSENDIKNAELNDTNANIQGRDIKYILKHADNNDLAQSIFTVKNSTPTSDDSKFVKVKFESNGGSTVPTQVLKAGERAIEPAKPIKDGYQFEGWYIDKELTQLYDFSQRVWTDKILYAKWRKIDGFDPTNGKEKVPSPNNQQKPVPATADC